MLKLCTFDTSFMISFQLAQWLNNNQQINYKLGHMGPGFSSQNNPFHPLAWDRNPNSKFQYGPLRENIA